jgi:hypothetical protein
VPTSPAAKPGPTRLFADTKQEMPRRPNERPSFFVQALSTARGRYFEPFSGLSLMGGSLRWHFANRECVCYDRGPVDWRAFAGQSIRTLRWNVNGTEVIPIE